MKKLTSNTIHVFLFRQQILFKLLWDDKVNGKKIIIHMKYEDAVKDVFICAIWIYLIFLLKIYLSMRWIYRGARKEKMCRCRKNAGSKEDIGPIIGRGKLKDKFFLNLHILFLNFHKKNVIFRVFMLKY